MQSGINQCNLLFRETSTQNSCESHAQVTMSGTSGSYSQVTTIS